MKVFTSTYVLAVLLFFMVSGLQAQDYKRAVKIKPFGEFGVSYKKLTGFERGYELILTSIPHGYSFTALRIYQEPAFPLRSDKWFVCYGFGTHISGYRSYSIYNPFRPFDSASRYNRNFVSVGFDGCAGLEYRFLKHPLTINVDYLPNFEFLGPDYFRVNHYITLGFAVVF